MKPSNDNDSYLGRLRELDRLEREYRRGNMWISALTFAFIGLIAAAAIYF
jgi:hypothetical protein